MIETQAMSPSVEKAKLEGLNFYQALQEMLKGKRVTKNEWENDEEYGFMRAEILHIHRDEDGGKDHRWVISEADIKGTDFRVLEDK